MNSRAGPQGPYLVTTLSNAAAGALSHNLVIAVHRCRN